MVERIFRGGDRGERKEEREEKGRRKNFIGKERREEGKGTGGAEERRLKGDL